jgi:ABC-2 type transport system ATP-binding protein
VELRKDMWEVVRNLQKAGATIVLTTHYIEEAEAMADRVAVINKGRILLVEDKDKLMAQMGQKELHITLDAAPLTIPDAVAAYGVKVNGTLLTYTYDAQDAPPLAALLSDLQKSGLNLVDVRTRQSSLEDIFVDLVKETAA